MLASEQGDFASARELFEESLALARRLESPDWVARAFSNLGSLAMYDDKLDEAVRLFEEPIAHWREVGNVRSLSLVTQNLGIALSGGGEHERAIALLGESVVLARRAEDPAHLSSALRSLARAQLLGAAAADAPALELLRESLALSRELGDRPGLAEGLETLAGVVEPRLGAELIGAAEGAREAAGAARQPDEERWVAEVKARLREALGEEAFAAAADSGRGLELIEAVARAVAV